MAWRPSSATIRKGEGIGFGHVPFISWSIASPTHIFKQVRQATTFLAALGDPARGFRLISLIMSPWRAKAASIREGNVATILANGRSFWRYASLGGVLTASKGCRGASYKGDGKNKNTPISVCIFFCGRRPMRAISAISVLNPILENVRRRELFISPTPKVDANTEEVGDALSASAAKIYRQARNWENV